MTLRMRDWTVIIPPCVNQYMAPEMSMSSLAGKVYGHAKLADGDKLITSGIIHADGRQVKTLTSNTYELEGDPSPRYLEYLVSLGVSYDPEHPLRTKKAE